jgi:hypothetical protein
MARIRVVLEEVVCYDTEDITPIFPRALDEFYLVGAVSDGAQSAGVLTVPISIGGRQRRGFGTGGGTVFDAEVPDERIVKVALAALDEDAAKDWARHGEIISEIGKAVSAGLATIPNPYTTTAAAIMPLAMAAIGGLVQLDQDDRLGEHLREFPAWALPAGAHTQIATFAGNPVPGYSDWRYSVRYQVIKS